MQNQLRWEYACGILWVFSVLAGWSISIFQPLASFGAISLGLGYFVGLLPFYTRRSQSVSWQVLPYWCGIAGVGIALSSFVSLYVVPVIGILWIVVWGFFSQETPWQKALDASPKEGSRRQQEGLLFIWDFLTVNGGFALLFICWNSLF